MADLTILQYVIVLWMASATVALTSSSLCGENEPIIPCTKIREVGCCIREAGSDSGFGNIKANPGSPTYLKVHILEDEDSLPKLNVTWGAPEGGASLEALTGFRIKINRDNYIVRFNRSLSIDLLPVNDQSYNYFNFTSSHVEYQSELVSVQITSLPVPQISMNWPQVEEKVNLVRPTEIKYTVNKTNLQKCEIQVRVKDKYIGSCNNVRLKMCKNPNCTKGKYHSLSNVFSSTQWALLTVNEVPQLFYIEVIPSAAYENVCKTAERKGAKSRTHSIDIRGNNSSCYIFDPVTMTTTEEIPSSAALDSSTSEPMDGGRAGSSIGSDNNSNKMLIPILITLGLAFVGLVFLFVWKKGRIIQQKRYVDDSKKMLPNGGPPSPTTKTFPENTKINIEDNTTARISNYSITSTHITVEWIPLVDNEQVSTYVVFLYNTQENACICDDEKQHTNTDRMSICLPIIEDVEKVHVVLVTMFSDGSHQSTNSEVITVPCPVDIHEKKILLIYSDDCKCHEETVTQFARLLASSKCFVMFERWDMDTSVDRRRWYENCLRVADKVIVIHSEGTYHKYLAYVERRSVEDNWSRSLGDTFRLALDLVLSLLDDASKESDDFRAKIRHVHFSYTPLEYMRKSLPLINRAATYCIMKNLKELVLSIHDLPVSSQTSDYDLPGLDQTAMDRLQKSIREATEYMNNNPSWHSQRYDSGIDVGSNVTGSSASSNCSFQGSSPKNSPECAAMGQNSHPMNIAIPEVSVDDNYTRNTYPNNLAPLRLAIGNHSPDIYDDLSTPEMSTTLSPGVGPLSIEFYGPTASVWADSDSQSDS